MAGGASSAGQHPIQSFASSVAATPLQSSRTPYPESSSRSELDRYWSSRRESFPAKPYAPRSTSFSREHETLPPNRTTNTNPLLGSLHAARRLGAQRESEPEQARQEPWPGTWRKQPRQKEEEEEEGVIVIEDSDDEDLEQQPEAAPRDWQGGRCAYAYDLAESTSTRGSSLGRHPYDTTDRDPRSLPPNRRTLETAAAQHAAEGESRRSAYALPSRRGPPDPDRLLEGLRSKRDMPRQQHSLPKEENDVADGENSWAQRYAEMRRSLSLRAEGSSRPSSSSEMPPPRQPDSPQDSIHGSGRNWRTSSPPDDHSARHQQPGMGAASSWFASLLPKPISSLLLPSPARCPPRSNPLAPPRQISPPRSSGSSRGGRPEGRAHHRRQEQEEEEEEEEADLFPPPLPRPSWLSATKRPQPRRLSDSDSRHEAGLRQQQKQQPQPAFSQGSSPTEPLQQQQQQQQQRPLSPQQPPSRLPSTASSLQLLPSSASPSARIAPNGASAAPSAATAMVVCRKTPQGSLRKRPASRKQEAPVRIVRAHPAASAAAPVPALLEPQPPPSDEDSGPHEEQPRRSAASLSPEASILSSEPLEQGGQQEQELQQLRRRRPGAVPQSKAARWEEQFERAPSSSSPSPPNKAERRGRKSQQPKRTPATGAKEAPQKQKQGTKRKHSEAPKASGGSKAAGGGEEAKKRAYRPCMCMKGKAVYGLLGDDREGARWCVACPSRPPHAVDVYRKRCDCGISQPSFALPGTLLKDAKWCSLCPGKPDAAVNVRSKRCECGRSQPSFGPPTGGKLGNARWCKVCPNKPPNAPNFRIRSKFEIHQKRRLNLPGMKVGRPKGTKNSTHTGGQGERKGPGRPPGTGAGGRGSGAGKGPGRPPGSGGGRGPGRPPGPASFTARMAALRRKQQQPQPVLRFPAHLKRERQLPLLRSGWGMDTVERRLRQRVADDGGIGGPSTASRPPSDTNGPKRQQQQSQNGSWAPSLAVLRAQQEQSRGQADPDENHLDL